MVSIRAPHDHTHAHLMTVRVRAIDGRLPTGVVRALRFVGDDEALVAALRAGSPAAKAELCDRYSDHVLRVLARILGSDGEIADLHHDVFARALSAIAGIKDPSALAGWLTIIAVNAARTRIKQRAMRRWLSFLPWNEVPEVAARAAPDEEIEALRRTYAVLDRLPTDERIVFSLRIIDGMELTDVAGACGLSLSTVKRRLARAEARFVALAKKEPLLLEWLEGGDRWGSPSKA